MLGLLKNGNFVIRNGKLVTVDSGASDCSCCYECNAYPIYRSDCSNATPDGICDRLDAPLYSRFQLSLELDDTYSDSIEVEFSYSGPMSRSPYSSPLDVIGMVRYTSIWKTSLEVTGLSQANGTYPSIRLPKRNYFNTVNSHPDWGGAKSPSEICDTLTDKYCCLDTPVCSKCGQYIFIPPILANVTARSKQYLRYELEYFDIPFPGETPGTYVYDCVDTDWTESWVSRQYVGGPFSNPDYCADYGHLIPGFFKLYFTSPPNIVYSPEYWTETDFYGGRNSIFICGGNYQIPIGYPPPLFQSNKYLEEFRSTNPFDGFLDQLQQQTHLPVINYDDPPTFRDYRWQVIGHHEEECYDITYEPITYKKTGVDYYKDLSSSGEALGYPVEQSGFFKNVKSEYNSSAFLQRLPF